MPNAVPVTLKAGQSVLYNNNLIHRGYTKKMKIHRRTLHMGYHSASTLLPAKFFSDYRRIPADTKPGHAKNDGRVSGLPQRVPKFEGHQEESL